MHCAEYMHCVHPEYIEDGDVNWYTICRTVEGTSALMAFYAHVSKKRVNPRKRKDPTDHSPYDYTSPLMFQSFQHVSGYKSAIVNELRIRGIKPIETFFTAQKNFFSGYERTIAREKQDGDRPLVEGNIYHIKSKKLLYCMMC